jgi:hypothetical protein
MRCGRRIASLRLSPFGRRSSELAQEYFRVPFVVRRGAASIGA